MRRPEKRRSDPEKCDWNANPGRFENRSSGVLKMARLGDRAGMPFLIHPHMLRHSCGFKYANEGKDTRSLQAYLGHRSIQSTVRYTAMAPTRFRGWERE